MPPLHPPHVQAALSFNRQARRFLIQTERAYTNEAVAKVVGESSGNYSAALRGIRGGTLDRVLRWMKAWEDAGYPSMQMVVSPGHAEVIWNPEETR